MSRISEPSDRQFFKPDSLKGFRELQLLSDISRQLQNIEDLPQQLSFILQNFKSVVRFDKSALYLYNRTDHSLRCHASVGMDLDEIARAEKIAMRGYPGWVMRSHQPLVLSDIEEDSEISKYGIDHGGSLAVVPVLASDRFIGAVSMESVHQNAFGQWEIYLLALFANQIALAVENANRLAFARVHDKKYQYLFDKAGIAFFSLGADGSITEANQAFLNLIGYESKAEVLQLNFFVHLIHSPNKGKNLRQQLNKAGTLVDVETSIRKRDGSASVMLLSSFGVKNSDDRIESYECLFKDVNEKKKLTEQLFKIQKMAALGTMTGGIAHDFNNLLSGIMGCASLILADMPETDPSYDDMQTIMTAAKKASELAKQLLTFSKEKTSVKPVSVNDLIVEVLKILSRTIDKNIHIKTYFFPGIAPVEGDATRIQQAFMNIFLNARDAMPDGGELTVETENMILDSHYSKLQMNLEPGDYVLIRVRDTGVGMDSETVKRIFEPFFTTKESGKGNGLGLAITQEIVKSHAGEIFVTSKPGRGTTFEIYLPAYSGQFEIPNVQSNPDKMPRGNETLLLVDDEEVIRKMGKRLLERFGYNVVSAADGQDALKRYKKTPSDIDLLILDMVMPKMNGKETLKQIRKINPNAKALLASGYLHENYSDKCMEDGFLGFIPKPFMASHILRMVRQSLDADTTKNKPDNKYFVR